MSNELHIHSCSQCTRDYLSKYVRAPSGGLCAHCIESVYNEQRRALKLKAAADKEFRDEEEQKRRDAERRRQRKP
jgi:hypothetical protein